MKRTTSAVTMLLMSVLLAGCLGGEDVDLQEDDGPPEPQEGLGTVTGSIFTIDLNEVEGADVRLVQDDEITGEAETDARGRYEIRNVEPGEYRLQVSAVCCKENVRSVQVEADDVVNVDLQLEPYSSDDLQEPRVERYEWRGFLACTLRFPNPEGPHHDVNVFGVPGGVTGVNVCGVVEIAADNATGDDFLHEFEVGPGLKSIVGGMEWQAPGDALGDQLSISMEVADRANLPPRYTSVDGQSPLEFRADAGDVIEEYDEEVDGEDIHQFDFENVEDSLTLMYRIFAGGDLNLVYQQQFTVYWDLYYWEEAPEGATALPDL